MLITIYKKMLVAIAAFVGIAWSGSAFALAPCSSITNLAQLMQAGTCYLSAYGPANKNSNDNVTISNVQTNIPTSAYSLVGVSIGVANWNQQLAEAVFNTDGLNGDPAYNQTFISLEAQCDGSCVFNDADVLVEGFSGSGVAVVNGDTGQINVPNSISYTDNFSKNVSNVKASANMTQTQIPNKSESRFTFRFNTLPTGSSSPASLCSAEALKILPNSP
jgi:hypothetical protein